MENTDRFDSIYQCIEEKIAEYGKQFPESPKVLKVLRNIFDRVGAEQAQETVISREITVLRCDERLKKILLKIVREQLGDRETQRRECDGFVEAPPIGEVVTILPSPKEELYMLNQGRGICHFDVVKQSHVITLRTSSQSCMTLQNISVLPATEYDLQLKSSGWKILGAFPLLLKTRLEAIEKAYNQFLMLKNCKEREEQDRSFFENFMYKNVSVQKVGIMKKLLRGKKGNLIVELSPDGFLRLVLKRTNAKDVDKKRSADTVLWNAPKLENTF